ncbi:hypothetical protein [Glutamicibacter mishrai]|nr:hypothetical protein [Glutamicibacter mishrai]
MESPGAAACHFLGSSTVGIVNAPLGTAGNRAGEGVAPVAGFAAPMIHREQVPVSDRG